jgi:multiple sugar transport system permease protein
MKKSPPAYVIMRKWGNYAFALPGILFIAVLIIIPIIYNVTMSFQNISLMNFARGERLFVGFDNYLEMIKTGVFRIALKNTLIFTFWCLLFQFPIGFAMALYFSKTFTGAGFMRGICLIAWMLPMVAVSGVFKFMFNGDVGVINYVLRALHIIKEPIQWLSTQQTAMSAIVIANIWKGVPFNMILLATALTTLPVDVYEAASIDGANPVQRFFYITVPLLKPAILSVLTLGFIYTFKVFDLVYVMTGGGPGSATEMLSTLAYRYSFNEYNFSQGATASNILFVILMCVGIIYINLVQREDK